MKPFDLEKAIESIDECTPKAYSLGKGALYAKRKDDLDGKEILIGDVEDLTIIIDDNKNIEFGDEDETI